MALLPIQVRGVVDRSQLLPRPLHFLIIMVKDSQIRLDDETHSQLADLKREFFGTYSADFGEVVEVLVDVYHRAEMQDDGDRLVIDSDEADFTVNVVDSPTDSDGEAELATDDEGSDSGRNKPRGGLNLGSAASGGQTLDEAAEDKPRGGQDHTGYEYVGEDFVSLDDVDDESDVESDESDVTHDYEDGHRPREGMDLSEKSDGGGGKTLDEADE